MRTFTQHARALSRGLPPEPEFLVSLTHADESQALIQPAGTGIVFLDAEVERDASRRSLCLEALDDTGAYAMALKTGKQLNTAQLNALRGAGNPHSADALVTHLDHAGHRAGALAPDLLHRPRPEILPPLPFVKAVRKAALSPRGLDDHVGEEPDILGSGRPHAVTEHASMLSPPAAPSIPACGSECAHQNQNRPAPLRPGPPRSHKRRLHAPRKPPRPHHPGRNPPPPLTRLIRTDTQNHGTRRNPG